MPTGLQLMPASSGIEQCDVSWLPINLFPALVFPPLSSEHSSSPLQLAFLSHPVRRFLTFSLRHVRWLFWEEMMA